MVLIGISPERVFAQDDASKDPAAEQDDGDNFVFGIHPDYRVRSLVMNPLELSGTRVTDMRWTEQRLRLDVLMEYKGVGGVYVQLDVLDGVLGGDNGRFNGSPSSNSGVSVASRFPNLTGWGIGLRSPDEGESNVDGLNPDNYGPVLVERDLMQVNYAYGDIILPFGLLKVGRQPLLDGTALAAHDGGRYRKNVKTGFNGRRHNRWGVSQYHDAVDRVLFGTKLDEAVKFITADGPYKPDLSFNRGVFVAGFFGWGQQNAPHIQGDDLYQVGGALQWKHDKASWGGLEWRDIFASAVLFHYMNEDFATSIWSVPMRLEGSVEMVKVLLQGIFIIGETREISEGFAALAGKDAQLQELKSSGAQAVVDVELGPVTLTFEFDYASGDADPRSDTPVTSYSYARDLNIGLLLFEHVIAFESARSVAVGIENLANVDSKSFPLTEAQTDGRFTNALALFPQVKVDWLDTKKHHLHTRFGVLFAWPAADGVVDPVMSVLNQDGTEVSDDVINYHGGDPGDYYGTEIDFQIQWVFADHFEWVIEAAVLIPGSSLENEHGDALTAFMFENRFAFVF